MPVTCDMKNRYVREQKKENKDMSLHFTKSRKQKQIWYPTYYILSGCSPVSST